MAYRPLAELPASPTPEAVECHLTFVGLVGMIDPARPEVKAAVALARHAGIKTVMVTGDYKNTALAIAKELDLISGKADEKGAASIILPQYKASKKNRTDYNPYTITVEKAGRTATKSVTVDRKQIIEIRL